MGGVCKIISQNVNAPSQKGQKKFSHRAQLSNTYPSQFTKLWLGATATERQRRGVLSQELTVKTS